MKELIRKFIPTFLLSWYHFLLTFFGAALYGFPSRKIKVIGVTGTNGKSTVVDLVTKVLEEGGFKVASLSSIKFKVGEKEWENKLKMTMPGRFIIQKLLKQAKNNKCQYFVLEVTSEGIKQHRHKFIDFDTVVFTNLSPEHIESHGSFEKYKEAKGELFKTTKKNHVINLDNENSEYFLSFPSKNKFGFTTKERKREFKLVRAENIQSTTSGTSFIVENETFNLNLIGEFNVYNALTAVCVGLSQGIDLETCKLALAKVEGIPGRTELVIKEPFKVMIDYAITPDALEKLYQTLKKLFSPNQMICVLGSCGGGRDRWKRPVLGDIALRYCDQIILTNEDSYNEDPMQIIEEIAKGTKEKAEKIIGRKEAIRKALSSAKEGDLVVITGKGCETWICLAGGKKIPWNEKEVVLEEFKKLSL